MTDSPAFKAPADPNEVPILDKLLVVRDKLLLIKQDKTKYVKSQDVTGFYEEIIEQVELLNGIRTNKKLEQNRLDTVLDDCLQLISLFFMTIGRNNEAPAAYSLVSTIKRLLNHLKEAAFFMEKDLIGIDYRLDKIEDAVERGKSHHSSHIVTLLEARILSCRTILAELRSLLQPIPKDLMPAHEKLVSILRSLSGCNARSKFPMSEVKDFKKQLRDIENGFEGRISSEENSDEMTIEERLKRYADKLSSVSYTEASKLPGREVVRDLLERTLLWGDIITVRQGRIDPRFQDTFSYLNGIRNQLERLSLTQAWSLRETDLYSYQRKLDRADEARVNENFVDDQGRPAELYEQRTLLYLLRKSYATIYAMLNSSEPVSEALQPIYNQLNTLRKCLVEVQRSGGVSSARELYPYSMKLNSLDNMRQDGKFVVNGDIPEGQASVISLLSECFEMAYELRTDAEKGDRDDEDEGERGEEKNEEEEEEEPAVEMKKATSGKDADSLPPDGGLTRVVSVGGE